VCSGAGAAALACLDLLVGIGIKREHIWVSDIKGAVYQGRTEEMDENKARYAQPTKARTLGEIIDGADIFLGLSAGGVLKPEMCKKMARDPLILALANPTPEILPEEARAARPDAIIATGRSDFPNQVNNVLCFPFIFRGALDVGATAINEEMKLACVGAIADLAMAEQSDIVASAYGTTNLKFGRDYLIPKPFDPRLISVIAPAVAKAAMDSGVATRPIEDFAAYHQHLLQFVYHSGLTMRPVFSAAKANPKRVVFAEGEDERVLRAVQVAVDEQIALPILVGRPDVIATRAERLGLRLRAGRDFELINPDSDPRYREYWDYYHTLMERKGVTVALAQREVRRRSTLIASLLLHFGGADAMLCGVYGAYALHLHYVENVIGRRPNVSNFAAMNMLMLPQRTIFIADTYVNQDPTAEQLTDITITAAEEMQRFGIKPKVALLSHSSFGSVESATAQKMRRVLQMLKERASWLEAEGEMHGDAALSEEIRLALFPNSRYKGEANLLIMPTLDAANIAFNLLKAASGDNITVGPMLLGAARPVHILTPTATVRRIVNMTALASVDAGAWKADRGTAP
jgi:malate dehydrogenase (oxaloacetate-decarboxylating)(NADP+)